MAAAVDSEAAKFSMLWFRRDSGDGLLGSDMAQSGAMLVAYAVRL